MVKNKLVKAKPAFSTQEYLDISEIKDGTVIMKDGTLRMVILVSSINFALKSEEEQNAIISAYVSFLNSLDFSIQIVIQSRELNIDKYIKQLKERRREQTNELLKMQIEEYTQYITELVSMGKIMSKHFYIVVPYNPLSDKQKGFFARLFDSFRPVSNIKIKEEKFARWRYQLSRRMENIISGLNSMGLNCAVLDTQSLIELYYNTYNPETSANQKLADVNDLRVD